MAGGLSVGVQLSAAWRDTAGRFAKAPVAGSIGAGLQQLGRDAVLRLVPATPVRTGRMQQGWRQTYVPSSQQIRIGNQAPYWSYVAFGTSRQAPNPELQAVISQDLPDMARTTVDAIGQQILVGLKG